MSQTVHVFAGQFESRDAACLYTEEQWEPEPDESASDKEYRAWENRNPTWELDDDLDTDCLCGDFIETIDGEDRVDYLSKMLVSDKDREAVRQSIDNDENVLVLIFDSAFNGHRVKLASTTKLRYLGEFRCNLFC